MTRAIKEKDQDTATDEKSRIEDRQRQEAAKRAEEGVDWHPSLFRRVRGGPGGSEEGEEDLDWIIDAKMYVVIIELYGKIRSILTLCQRRKNARRTDEANPQHCGDSTRTESAPALLYPCTEQFGAFLAGTTRTSSRCQIIGG